MNTKRLGALAVARFKTGFSLSWCIQEPKAMRVFGGF
jgi:hypothetical protein